MRELLEKWSKLEPHLCHKQLLGARIECFTIQLNGQWETILVYNVDTGEARMKIQWAVQQAIIEKGWWLEVSYTPSSGYSATITLPRNKARKFNDNSMAEVLLAAYLEMVESSANP